MAEGEILKIEKYKQAIKDCDRVDENKYEARLTICKACEKLNAGTCIACGCYVELRALGIKNKCPDKRW